MKITVKKLKELNACDSGIEYFKSKHSKGVELTDLICEDIETNDWTILKHANWLIAHCMTYKQCVDYALYASELALPEYEEKYPNDSSVHDCIQAIKDFRDGGITRKQLLDAVDNIYVNPCVGYAAYIISKVAYGIAGTTYAADVAYATAYATADKKATMIKILEYGVTLLEGKK